MIDNNIELFHRLDNAPKGLALYEVQDDQTKKYKKITVPEENADRFEKMIGEISQSSLRNFSSDKFIKQVSLAGSLSAVAGCGISFLFTRKSKFLTKIAGGLGGAFLGAFAAVSAMFFNLINKLGNLSKMSKNLGIKEYKEEKSLEEKSVKEEKVQDKSEEAKQDKKEEISPKLTTDKQEEKPAEKSVEKAK